MKKEIKNKTELSFSFIGAMGYFLLFLWIVIFMSNLGYLILEIFLSELKYYNLYLSSMFGIALSVSLFLYLVLADLRSLARIIGKKLFAPKIYLITILVTFGFYILNLEIVKLVQLILPINDMLSEFYLIIYENNLLTAIILVAIIPGIFEELLFRGFFLTGLKRKYNSRIAIIFSSLLFAIIHFNLHQTVIAFIAGLLLGLIYDQTNSLLLVVIIHTLNNVLAVLAIHYFGVADIILTEIEFIPLWKLLLVLLFTGLGICYLTNSRIANN